MSYVRVGALFEPTALGPDAELLDKIIDLFDLSIGKPGFVLDYGVTLVTGDVVFEIELPDGTQESAVAAVECLQKAVRTVGGASVTHLAIEIGSGGGE